MAVFKQGLGTEQSNGMIVITSDERALAQKMSQNAASREQKRIHEQVLTATADTRANSLAIAAKAEQMAASINLLHGNPVTMLRQHQLGSPLRSQFATQFANLGPAGIRDMMTLSDHQHDNTAMMMAAELVNIIERKTVKEQVDLYGMTAESFATKFQGEAHTKYKQQADKLSIAAANIRLNEKAIVSGKPISANDKIAQGLREHRARTPGTPVYSEGKLSPVQMIAEGLRNYGTVPAPKPTDE